MKKNIVFLAAMLVVAASCTRSSVYDLSCEGLVDPLGIDNLQPHLSWKVASGAERMKAYRIQVASSPELLSEGKADVWDSGVVESACSVMVPWAGPELRQAQECWWRVKVWAGGASRWSAAARFSIGYIDGLQGDYIGAFAGTDQEPVFCGNFCATEGDECFVHVNSLGYHELLINGQKVGEEVLAPAVTQLDKRSLIVTYDVSDHIISGNNSIAIAAAKGWYRSNTFGAVYDGPLVKAQVDVKRPDGSWQNVCVTGPDWTAVPGGRRILGSWLPWNFGGEEIDARKLVDLVPDAGDPRMCQVDTVCVEGIRAVPAMCRANKVKEVLYGQSVEELPADSYLYGRLAAERKDFNPGGRPVWVIDMGKCLIGQVEYALPELPEGAAVQVFFSDDEMLREYIGWDTLISSGKAETLRERFCLQAFRKVIVCGLPGKPSPDMIKACRISEDMAEASTFECSDPDMNAIHDMLHYTLQNLTFSGYQVDCPHIERMGYGGDGNSSTMTTQTMYDAAPVYLNWLAAWEDSIEENGSLPHTAPNPYPAGGGPYWCGFPIMASYRTLLNYGDPRPLERFHDLMVHWLDYVDAYTVDGLLRKWPDTEHRGWYLGDWLPPCDVDATDPESVDLVNNCSLSQNLAALADAARQFGHDAEADAFDARRLALNKRIHEEFFHPESNTYASGSQIDLAYPMLVDAVPEEFRAAVKDALKEYTVQKYGGHLVTGLVGVPILAEWAVKEGECEFMYGMLKQRDYPGYLYMIDNGASTTWEEWDDPRSHIHNCFNGIGTWFYQALGGLVPAFPGYRLFTIRPQIPSGIDWVRVTKETPYGTIELSWKKEGATVHYDVTIPCGTEALFSPTGAYLYAGRYSFDVKD
ncbi:MAG: glycoside hydrolase family 78 protein [Bacteroidales bacterium]|nr:glycoside hydrolase family 78 protein [Bacteroidales bacterium]